MPSTVTPLSPTSLRSSSTSLPVTKKLTSWKFAPKLPTETKNPTRLSSRGGVAELAKRRVAPTTGQSFPLGYICREVYPNQISDAVSKHRRCEISTTGGVRRRKINYTVMRGKPRRACAVTQPALAKARGLRSRVSRRRALPWLAANWWGRPTVRQLPQAVVEISRVPRLSTESVMICYSGS